VAAVTVTVDRTTRRVDVVILWTGGATSTHTAFLPPIGIHTRTSGFPRFKDAEWVTSKSLPRGIGR
jgi:hypothetical protein